MFYAERASAPTRASSPRQLPTDHGHAVSTREYQSDQSSRSSLAVTGSAVRSGSGLTSRNVFPLRRPSTLGVSARTVLGGKGSLSPRQTTPRPCHLCAVPAQTVSRRAAPAGTLPRGSQIQTAGCQLLAEGNRPEISDLCQHP